MSYPGEPDRVTKVATEMGRLLDFTGLLMVALDVLSYGL